ANQRTNVFVIDPSFSLSWGGSSIVFVQLEGFFSLLDLASWDYVINLSGYDYPLQSTLSIHTYVSKFPGKIWINWWEEWEVESRITRPMFPLKNFAWCEGPASAPNRNYEATMGDRFPKIKHHQWMILSREFIEHLRVDRDAHDLLAWMEHTWIPDESYFGMGGRGPSARSTAATGT
ncbi:hypothetical protein CAUPRSCDRAFT_13186, partial [Caulochytrium protostelioides]